jgi:phosphoribosylamine--glycine ligase
MKLLIIGSGGREHALAWRAARSPLADHVFVAPGNAGTATEPGCSNIDMAVGDFESLARFAREEEIGLTIVGPEVPLVDGIVDHFQAVGLKILGPSAAAAILEGSKGFSKIFMQKHNIPTADYRIFDNASDAIRYCETLSPPYVLKADGLAAGKGVIIASSLDDARDALRDMIDGASFGAAGSQVVIEEFLEGEEASFIVLSDGETALPFATSQDHKRVGDGDSGPNTGGMGAYSPAPVVDESLHRRVMEEIIQPTIRAMAAEGRRYVGFLYAGLMITPAGDPKVIEFNCRFGDPEAQPVMMRLESDLVELALAACDGALAGMKIDWHPGAALGVVMAAAGYPGSYPSGDPIVGIKEAESSKSVKVFHAGTRVAGDSVVTSGGRVLCVTALGEDIATARSNAYSSTARIEWQGAHYRRDIGNRALARA